MANLFDIQEREVKDGRLLHANFTRHYEGVVAVYVFDSLKIELEEDRTKLDIDGNEWVGAYENPEYRLKDRQPFNRFSPATYFQRSFNDLDILPMSNGGRFFSSKQLMPAPLAPLTVQNYPERERAYLHPSNALREFSDDLNLVLELIGVQQEDFGMVRRNVYGKLGYPTG